MKVHSDVKRSAPHRRSRASLGPVGLRTEQRSHGALTRRAADADRYRAPRSDAEISNHGRLGGRPVQERSGPLEDVAEAVTREPRLIRAVAGRLPSPRARSAPGQRRTGDRLPGPTQPPGLTRSTPATTRFDELREHGIVMDLVAYEPQSGQTLLDQPALRCGSVTEYPGIRVEVIAHHGRVNHRHRPHRVTDRREGRRPIRLIHEGQPPCGVPHRRHRPLERPVTDHWIPGQRAVPRHPATRRTEWGVFTPRREHGAALLASPGLRSQNSTDRRPWVSRPSPGRSPDWGGYRTTERRTRHSTQPRQPTLAPEPGLSTVPIIVHRASEPVGG